MTDTQGSTTNADATPSYVYIDAFGLWATPDGSTFAEESEAVAHANRDLVEADVQAFMAYVDAHPEIFFTRPGKRLSTRRDGTVVPAAEARPMEQRAVKAVRTRIEKIARVIYSGVAVTEGT